MTGACTNVVEGNWRILKSKIPNRQYHDGEKLQEHLYEYKWRQQNRGNLWNAFFRDLALIRFDEEAQTLFDAKYGSHKKQEAARNAACAASNTP